MSSDPLRMFRGSFSVDVTTAGVQATGFAPQPVTFGSIDIGSAPAAPPAPMPVPPAPPAGQQPPQVAGVWDMATSFGTSMAKFATSGFKTVPQEIHAQRMALCNSCQHHTGTRCVLCGCFTHAKAWMPHESCPLLKWLAVQQ